MAATSKVIATKVAPDKYEKFCKIAERFGLNRYQLQQGLFMALLRAFDENADVCEELYNMANTFITLGASHKDNKAFSSWQNVSAESAVIFTKHSNEQKPLPVLVTYDGSHTTANYNADAVFTKLLEAYAPGLLKGLKRQQERTGNFTLLNTLQTLIEDAERETDQIAEDVAELFRDNERTPIGEQRNEDVFYKRKFTTQDSQAAPAKRKTAVCF